MQDSIYLRWVDTKWPLVKESDDLLAELANDYFTAYGQTTCCPEVLSTFHADILREYKQHLENIKQRELMSTEQKKFILKEGIMKYIASEDAYFTNDNLTDEIAEKLLRTSPKAVADFDVYPSDFDFGKPDPDTTPDPDITNENTSDQVDTPVDPAPETKEAKKPAKGKK